MPVKAKERRYINTAGNSRRRPFIPSAAGTLISNTITVMMTAMTPSEKASSRPRPETDSATQAVKSKPKLAVSSHQKYRLPDLAQR